MQFALTIVLIVAVVMCVATWLNPRTVGRTTVCVDRPALNSVKGKHNG